MLGLRTRSDDQEGDEQRCLVYLQRQWRARHLTLNAYLTLPAGRHLGDAGVPLPMALLPHGAPHSRDDAGFDPWTEFLGDRGYLVLETFLGEHLKPLKPVAATTP